MSVLLHDMVLQVGMKTKRASDDQGLKTSPTYVLSRFSLSFGGAIPGYSGLIGDPSTYGLMYNISMEPHPVYSAAPISLMFAYQLTQAAYPPSIMIGAISERLVQFLNKIKQSYTKYPFSKGSCTNFMFLQSQFCGPSSLCMPLALADILPPGVHDLDAVRNYKWLGHQRLRRCDHETSAIAFQSICIVHRDMHV